MFTYISMANIADFCCAAMKHLAKHVWLKYWGKIPFL